MEKALSLLRKNDICKEYDMFQNIKIIEKENNV
jgi:hypothetical protein